MTSEIILYIITGLFTTKEIWMTVRNVRNKKTQIQLAEIDSESKSISEIKSNYSELKAKFKVMAQSHKEMKISFSVILPALEKLVEDDPSMQGSFDVVKKYFTENEG